MIVCRNPSGTGTGTVWYWYAHTFIFVVVPRVVTEKCFKIWPCFLKFISLLLLTKHFFFLGQT